MLAKKKSTIITQNQQGIIMKKILISAVLLTASSSAMAAAPGGPNCGWGNMLFEGQSGLGAHIIASITNEPKRFGGALYRLGAILFGTHSSKVSLWLHFQFPTLERFFTFLFVISRLLNTWDRYNP